MMAEDNKPVVDPVEPEGESTEPTIEVEEASTAPPIDDDLLVIEKANDSTLEEEDNFAVFKQEEGMIAWSIQNFYNEDGSIRSKRELKLDPAILRVEAGNGDPDGVHSVEFLLTRDFTKSLSASLKTVELASYGIQKTKKPLVSFKESLIASAVDKPFRALLLGALIVLTPLFLFVF